MEDGFEPVYEVPEDSKRHVADLKRALKGADELVLATDYDREGEAIAFHVATLLGVAPDQAKRITFTEITRDAILESVRHPRAIDLKLVDAQEAAGSSTVSSAIGSARSCGGRCGPGCPRAGCSRSPSA